ncbi:MAG: universal stress protein [Phycisphaerales bacterium]|nr:MAG: universal stress protein [Phycisphaerales bacterium]
MSMVLAFITDSPSAARVASATLLMGRALGMRARFVHYGAEGSAGTARVRAVIDSADASVGRRDVADDEGASPVLDVRAVEPRTDRAIHACIAELKPTLVVIGAVQRERTLRDVFGSTARRVAQRSPCSVLLVSTRGREPGAWSRLLMGVEDGPHGRSLGGWMLHLARACGERSTLCLAHERKELARGGEEALNPPGVVRLDVGLDSGQLYGMAAERHQLADFAESLETQGVRIEAVTLPGRPGQEIARYAEDTRADVLGLVAPARPLGLLSRLLSHPVLLVLEHLPCAVLLYRPAASTESGVAS